MTKVVIKKIGTANWKITYPEDIYAELEKDERAGYHVSDWAWQHAYCIGLNLDTGKERWLPKNYVEMLLEENARENFMSIYYDEKWANDRVQLHREFDECWAQLQTRKEKEDFAINCCYYIDKETGKCKIYFHAWDRKDQCYDDLELDEYRNREKYRYEIWNSIE